MSKNPENEKRADRGPSRSTASTQEGQRILTSLFVNRFLRPSKHTVPLNWLKVFAERAVGKFVFNDDHYQWIDEGALELALKEAGYRVRRTRGDPFAYVACAPQGANLKTWRFFKRGGSL